MKEQQLSLSPLDAVRRQMSALKMYIYFCCGSISEWFFFDPLQQQHFGVGFVQINKSRDIEGGRITRFVMSSLKKSEKDYFIGKKSTTFFHARISRCRKGRVSDFLGRVSDFLKKFMHEALSRSGI
jgi:hypothetical protein